MLPRNWCLYYENITFFFLLTRTCIRPVVVYGGTQTIHSIRQIMQGCNILCATPGRLLDIINREKVGVVRFSWFLFIEFMAFILLWLGACDENKPLKTLDLIIPLPAPPSLAHGSQFGIKPGSFRSHFVLSESGKTSNSGSFIYKCSFKPLFKIELCRQLKKGKLSGKRRKAWIRRTFDYVSVG